MNRVVAGLTVRSLLGRRRVFLLLAPPMTLLLICGAIRSLGEEGAETSAHVLSRFALATVVSLVSLMAGTGAIGPEIEDGSITYLLAKPVNRFSVLLSKSFVALTVIVACTAVPVTLAGLVLAPSDARVALAFAAGATVAGIAYGTLFLLLAILSRHAVMIGLLYALIWESLVAGVAPGAQDLSVRQWALALTQHILGNQAAALDVKAAVPLTTGLVLLGLLTVGSTLIAGRALSGLRLSSHE